MDGRPVGEGGEGRSQGGSEARSSSWHESAPRAARTGRRSEAIVWKLAGDTLVLRIPLGRVVRRIAALKVLAAIKREMGR